MKRSRFCTHARGAMAIRPSALSIFWEWGCGDPNEVIGPATVVNVNGPIEQRSSWFDGYDAIVERFREALASDSPVIMLRIDSPGGECAGLLDAVDKMRALASLRADKRVVAFADESAYSAAYALACVAPEIYIPRSGGVGSVGVIAVVADQVGWNDQHGLNVAVITNGDRKADCHPDIPLSAEALAGVQADVDTLAGHFRALVSSSRGISDAAIVALEAATFMGDAALEAGLADGVMSFDELIVMLASDTKKPAATATTTQGQAPMKNKAKATPLDALSAPKVAPIDPSAFSALASTLGGKPVAAKAKAETEEDAEDEESTTSTTTVVEDVAEDGTTTTTTDYHEETTSTPASEDEEPSDDEPSDDEEEEAPPSSKPGAIRTKTSGDVLACIREITGCTSPGEQIGALHAMRDQAKSARKAKASAAKAAESARASKLTTMVDRAISAGKLAPSQRAWAMSAGLEVVNGYLANAPAALVRTKPSVPSAKGAALSTMDPMHAEIAAKCGLDASAVQEHATKLAAAGIIPSVH